MNQKNRYHVVMVTLYPENIDEIKGGVAGVARYLTQELVKKEDIILTIVVPTSRRGSYIEEDYENYKIIRLGRDKKWSWIPSIIYEDFIRPRQLNEFLANLKPDIVHYQGKVHWAIKSNFINVVTIHGIPDHDAIWEYSSYKRWIRWAVFKFTEAKARKKVKNVIVISKYVESFLKESSYLKNKWLIENPVSDEYFNLKWDFEPGRILYCGRVIERKNVLSLIKAFSSVSASIQEATLRVAGSGEPRYIKRCEELVDKLGLADRVKFLGNLLIKQVKKELVKANCLVLPSFQETAPLAIEEAMAVGVPIISSNICGMPYMIENGVSGILIDPYRVESIANAIKTIISDKDLAVLMGNRSREIAETRFKASIVSNKTELAYRGLLGESY